MKPNTNIILHISLDYSALKDRYDMMSTLIIIYLSHMNDSVGSSLILRDNDQHIRDHLAPLSAKIVYRKKLLIMAAVLATLLVVSTCYFAFSSAVPKEVLDQNTSLRELNSQLKAKSAQLAQRLLQSINLNIELAEQNISLSKQLQKNKDLVLQLQKEIQLNCNPLKQRLRFNMTNMEAFTLSVINTNTRALGDIPQIIFLNMSGDILRQFSGNSLPTLEYLDLNGNPLTKISNNKLDKIVDLVGTTFQPLLNDFTSNYMPSIKTLNLSHGNISSFRDNTISAVQTLDISDNKPKSFSSLNSGALQRLNISTNPITEFSMNNFTNLAQFSSLFLVGPEGPSILFNDSYFGKVKHLQLRSKSNSAPPASLDFRNNYFPSLTNLSLIYFTNYYQDLKTNRMAQLVDLKLLYCNLIDNIQYFPEWNSLISLQYVRSIFKAFTWHSYPKMLRLHINQSNVQEFSSNYLPILEELIISDKYTSTKLSISNNTFKNLKTLVFSVPTISDMSWLQSLHKLSYLELAGAKLGAFEGYDMPRLEILKLDNISITSFKNNTFPSLKDLAISDLLVPFDVSTYQGQLQRLQLSSPQRSFENYSFPNLKYLYLQSKNSCTFANNSFPVLQQLWIQNTDFTQSNHLPVIKQFFFHGSENKFQLPHKYQSTIEQLLLMNTNVDSFENYNMPKVKVLRITGTRLSSFSLNKLPKATVIYLSYNLLQKLECVGFPAVQELSLSNNIMSDKIVDTLIGCNLAGLTLLNLKGNLIKNIDDAKDRLTMAYPKAKIVI